MLNKTEFLAMSIEQIYQAMLNGKLSVEQFQEWIEEDLERARQNGYEAGYNDGYADCQDDYGDDPSS